MTNYFEGLIHSSTSTIMDRAEQEIKDVSMEEIKKAINRLKNKYGRDALHHNKQCV